MGVTAEPVVPVVNEGAVAVVPDVVPVEEVSVVPEGAVVDIVEPLVLFTPMPANEKLSPSIYTVATVRKNITAQMSIAGKMPLFFGFGGLLLCSGEGEEPVP